MTSTVFTSGTTIASSWLNDVNTAVYTTFDWTPTLVGWTNVGTPVITAKYTKSGSLITFYVTITPATSISAILNTSTIRGLPYIPLAGSGMQTDNNGHSYGNAVVSASSGYMYPQTTGVITTAITIVGTMIISV